MNLNKIIETEKQLMQENSVIDQPETLERHYALNVITSVVDVLKAYETFGTDKRGAWVATGKAIQAFVQYAIKKQWEEYLYLIPDAIEEAEERGYMYGGVKGALFETLSYIHSASFWSVKKHPLFEVAKQLNQGPHENSFNTAWSIFITTMIVEFKFDFNDLEGKELEYAYYDYINEAFNVIEYDPCIACKAAIDTERDEYIPDDGTGQPWCIPCADKETTTK